MITLLKVDEIWAWPVASTLTTLFDDVVVFAIIHLVLLGRLLLVGNGLLLSLSGTGIVLSALTAYRKTDTMTDTSVATDIHQSFDVHLDGGTKLTLDLVLLGDEGTYSGYLIVVPFTDLDVVIDSALLENLSRGAAADTVDVGETYLTSFVVR